MGKLGAFLEHSRVVPARRLVGERVRDWREVDQTGDETHSRAQAGRCMDCGIPFCTQGCPLGNPVPEFADLVAKGRWRDAYTRLASTNDFPEFTGRLCPAPCEAACVLAIDKAPVTIEHLERAIVERAFAEGWITAQPPRTRTGKRVAVVGSGPAGLAAASQLNRAGHSVVVYEADAEPGGLLRFGIPDFKLEKAIIDRRIALLVEEGIEFRCNTRVASLAALEADAIVLAIGAMQPRELDIPGRDLAGVTLAMDFLVRRDDLTGKRVVILGGGDTGSDCLGTAHRLNAVHVHQLELLPTPPSSSDVWPRYPMIFRTSSSQEEGGDRAYGVRTTHFSGDGRVQALHTDDGAVIECDLVILALGFTGVAADLGVATSRGRIAVDNYATSQRGVFSAGDATRGASLIVWAIAEGRECARAVDSYLRGGDSSLPAIGQSNPF